MGIGSVFKKIGGGALKVGKVIANLADIPFAKELVAVIPIAGPGLAIAIRYIDEAENVFSADEKSGAYKRGYALELIEKALDDLNLDSKQARALLEVALLINKKEAFLREIVGVYKEGEEGGL